LNHYAKNITKSHFISMLMKYSPLNQKAIVKALRGQTLRVPNLHSLFRSWPEHQPKLNRHHEHVKPMVDQAIDRMASKYPLIARRKKDDIAKLLMVSPGP
jgi:Tfp pilus assembly major pilin PilA